MRLHLQSMSCQRWFYRVLLSSLVLIGRLSHPLASPPVGEAMPNAGSKRPLIRVERGLVSAQIAKASLDEVLREISTQSRIGLVLDASRQERISANFQALPLDEALRILVKENFLLLYGIDGQLTGVWILRDPRQRLDSGASESFDSLLVALHSGDAERRKKAVWLLGELKDERALTAVLDALKGDGDAEVRQHAAWALENLGDHRAVDALTETVFGDSDGSVRQRAVEALARIDEHEALEPLTQALREDLEPFVRYEALVNLTEIGGDGGVDFLLQALHDPEELVRAKAEEMLRGAQGHEQ